MNSDSNSIIIFFVNVFILYIDIVFHAYTRFTISRRELENTHFFGGCFGVEVGVFFLRVKSWGSVAPTLSQVCEDDFEL